MGLYFQKNDNHLNIIKDYFKQLEKREKSGIKIQQPLKIMLLGNHSSGKTTFYGFFNTGEIKNENNSTHVLNIHHYNLPAKNTAGSKLPDAVFYDFGGQDYYHGTYQAFFSLQCLTLLFWHEAHNSNSIKDDSSGKPNIYYDVNYWLGQHDFFMDSLNKGSNKLTAEQLYLIQTYADVNAQSFKEYNGIQHRFYISLKEDFKNDLNLAALQYLKAAILQPIKNRQEELESEDVLKLFEYIFNYEEFEKIPIKQLLEIYNQEDNDEGISLLKGRLSRLHNSGMVMYYEHIKEIQNYVWLNPSKLISHVHENILSKKLIENGIVNKEKFEKTVNDEELLALLKANKVVFLDKQKNEYIIPNYLKLLDEDSDDFFIFHDFQTFDLQLKFKNFIPFGFINNLICHFGQNPDKKTYRRNHLMFTLDGKLKVMIHLDFEKLIVNVAFKPTTNFKLPSNFKKGFLLELLELYKYGNVNINRRDLEIEEASEDTIHPYNKVLTLENRYEYYSFNNVIPTDLFVSINQKDFVNFATLEDETVTQSTILAYHLENDGSINEKKGFSVSTYPYKSISSNPNLVRMKKVFISYSRQNVEYKDELRKYLSFAKLFGVIDHWACEDIKIGNWHEQIQKELEEADLVIMMLSIDFFNSRYIVEQEVLKTMQAIENGSNKKIYPILVTDLPSIDKLNKISNNDDHVTNAIVEMTKHQYGVYDKEAKFDDGKSERIFTLREFKNKNRLDYALSKIVNKIMDDLV